MNKIDYLVMLHNSIIQEYSLTLYQHLPFTNFFGLFPYYIICVFLIMFGFKYIFWGQKTWWNKIFHIAIFVFGCYAFSILNTEQKKLSLHYNKDKFIILSNKTKLAMEDNYKGNHLLIRKNKINEVEKIILDIYQKNDTQNISVLDLLNVIHKEMYSTKIS